MQTRIGFGLGLGMTRGMTAAVAWLPSALFAASEQGVWYDPSDFSTMYQENTGVTPVTAVGQTVGFLGDKSKGYTLGPELVTNGDFATDTNWTKGAGWTISGGQLVGTSVAAFSSFSQSNVAVVGKVYRLTFEVTVTSGSVEIGLPGGSSASSTFTTTGTYSRTFTAATATLSGRAGGGGFTGTIDNVSVRELPGNHATQATAASRPVLGRVPLGGRRNLFIRTEEFDNAAWGKFSGWAVSANATAAPDGTTTADAIIPTAGTSLPYMLEVVTVAASQHTASIYIKAGDAGVQWVRVLDNNHTNGTAWFDIVNGTVGTVRAGVTATIEAAANGFWRIDITLTKANTSLEYALAWAFADNDAATTRAWDGSEIAFYLWGAQLETGSTATAYQKVVTALDVTEAGVANVHYLRDDAVDDTLNWTAPADTDYTVAWVDSGGTVTIQTAQSLSGSTDMLRATQIAGYVAVDRALTAGETADLTAYLEGLA